MIKFNKILENNLVSFKDFDSKMSLLHEIFNKKCRFQAFKNFLKENRF